MINKKILFVLLGVFFIASICGVIFHFNTKNDYSLLGATADAMISTNGSLGDEDGEVAEETPLDRDGVNTEDAKVDGDVDASTGAVEIENDTEMGDALWEEARNQEDSVIEATDEPTDGTVEATEVGDVPSDETVDEVNTDADESEANKSDTKKKDTNKKDNKTQTDSTDPDVIGKFTVNNTGLVVRTGPRGTYDALDTLPVGTTGDIVEVVNDYWVKIKFGDSEAYICSKYAVIEIF